MDWLCRFVKDKGCAGIIDFVVFSVRATRIELTDKPIELMWADFLFKPQIFLSRLLNPEVFCNIKMIFPFLTLSYFKENKGVLLF